MSKLFYLPSEKGSALKGKNLLPLGRAGPRRSEDGMGGGGGGGGRGGGLTEAYIERRKLREGESMRGVSPLIRGSGGLPGKFLKLDCLRVHFHAIFIFINLAG